MYHNVLYMGAYGALGMYVMVICRKTDMVSSWH
jgi:hypothetical protein